MSDRPLLTIIVVFHNMRREAERTLYTLSVEFQRHLATSEYNVIVLDHGSSEPLTAAYVCRFGSNFSYRFIDTVNPSPVMAINLEVEKVQTELVMVMIDGAHMLSPGVISNALRAARACPNPFVTVVGFHLGTENQNRAVVKGYDQEAEDRLLGSVDWRANGYRLFELAGELSYDCAGWFGPLAESNCFLLQKTAWQCLGGFTEGFTESGGGLAILDFFRRAMLAEDLDYVVLLGEGTFHQFHGGVASNAPYAEHPWDRFHLEYRRLRGEDYQVVARRPIYWGKIPLEADLWSRRCARVGFDWWQAEAESPHDMKNFFPEIGYAMLAAKADPGEEKSKRQLADEVMVLKRQNDQLQAELQLAAEKSTATAGRRRWWRFFSS